MRTTALPHGRKGRWTRCVLVSCLVTVFTGSDVSIIARPGPVRTAPRSEAVVRVSAGGERIASIRTSRGVTTMLSLPAEAKEAVCGDLFDAQTGNGCFVIQRSGRDLFLKPLKPTGATNLFVKTEAATYAFDLVVVPADRAMRIVFVDTAAPDRAVVAERAKLERDRAALELDREQLAKDRLSAATELDRLRTAVEEESRARAETIARQWVADGLVDAVAITRRTARGRNGFEIVLGSVALRLGERTALRCTMKNAGPAAVVVATAEWSDGARRVTPVHAVVPAGGEVSVALWFPGAPGVRGDLRLLDPAGMELVAIQMTR